MHCTAQSIDLLDNQLSAAIDLYIRSKHARWIMSGPTFIAIHRLLDELADVAASYADKIAERAAALVGTAHDPAPVVAERSFLPAYRFDIADKNAQIGVVSRALAAFGDSLHRAIAETARIGDGDTEDLFREVSRGIDYYCWLVESHDKLASRP